MVHERCTLANEHVDFVAEAHGFMQRYTAQTHRSRNALVQHFGSGPVEPVPFELFAVVAVEDLVEADDVAGLVGRRRRQVGCMGGRAMEAASS